MKIEASLFSFERAFGRPAEVRAEAPGRVNLIGEHTDYNGGYVLPMTIPQRTVAEVARRADRRVIAVSANVGEDERRIEYGLGEEVRGGRWYDYLEGVTATLALAGHELPGFEILLHSTVPLGSGLSSSAALEVSVLRALRKLLRLTFDDVELAKLGQRAEVDFVGAPVGIMDQMASSLGDTGNALFLDTRTLEFQRVPIPRSVELVVINSGVTHGHAGGEYRTRRAECEQAARLLGVPELRDVTTSELGRVDALPEPFARRARHVIKENQRVLDTVAALRAEDCQALGALLYASHDSMQRDFEVSIPEIDAMVEIARRDADVIGARLTGGGFGGSVVILVRAGSGGEVGRRVAAFYGQQTGRRATVLVPEVPG